jgi:hypothetical protein
MERYQSDPQYADFITIKNVWEQLCVDQTTGKRPTPDPEQGQKYRELNALELVLCKKYGVMIIK